MGRVRFNYAKLKGRIKEKCGSQREFARALGISEMALSCKVQGHTYFTQSEIWRCAEILEIEPNEVAAYFFTV